MSRTYALLLLLFVSCTALEEQVPFDGKCDCDYMEIFIDEQWWVIHPKDGCEPHGTSLKQDDRHKTILIH